MQRRSRSQPFLAHWGQDMIAEKIQYLRFAKKEGVVRRGGMDDRELQFDGLIIS